MRSNFSNKKVIIMGLGLHGGGVSSAIFFARSGARVLVTDMKSKEKLEPSLKKLQKYKNISFVLNKHRVSDFETAKLIIRNPAVPNDSKYLKIARRHKIPVHTDISLFLSIIRTDRSQKKVEVIGITGTKGKSTTVTLLHHVLLKNGKKVLLAGNIRKSPLDFLKITSTCYKLRATSYIILELSSWHLESLNEHKIAPDIALITNILKDHLNRYKNFADYAKSKAYIFKHQTKKNVLFLNKLDAESIKLPNKFVIQPKIFWFKAKKQKSDLRHPDNTAAVFAICEHLKLPRLKIQNAVCKFKGLSGRLEYLDTIGGADYYNDTCATQPDATIYAIQKLFFENTPKSKKIEYLKNVEDSRHLILICGGADKALDYKQLVIAVVKYCSYAIVYKGANSDTASDKIISEFQNQNFAHFSIKKSLFDCVQRAADMAKNGDIILFSPAASSFGKFKHEFDRGDKFKKAVALVKLAWQPS